MTSLRFPKPNNSLLTVIFSRVCVILPSKPSSSIINHYTIPFDPCELRTFENGVP